MIFQDHRRFASAHFVECLILISCACCQRPIPYRTVCTVQQYASLSYCLSGTASETEIHSLVSFVFFKAHHTKTTCSKQRETWESTLCMSTRNPWAPKKHWNISCSTEYIIIIINPLTARAVGVPQIILQPVLSIFPCSPLPSGICRTLSLSIP